MRVAIYIAALLAVMNAQAADDPVFAISQEALIKGEAKAIMPIESFGPIPANVTGSTVVLRARRGAISIVGKDECGWVTADKIYKASMESAPAGILVVRNETYLCMPKPKLPD